MIFLDLTILASPRHLAAAMFLGRASDTQLCLQRDDLHQLYWLASGIVAFRGYSGQHNDFEDFFHDCHPEMRAALPSNPRLDSLTSSLALVEIGLDQEWIVFADGNWEMSGIYVNDLYALPSSALYGIRDWDGDLADFLEQPWAGEPEKRYEVPAEYVLGGDVLRAIPLRETTSLELAETLRALGKRHYEETGEGGDFILQSIDNLTIPREDVIKDLEKDLRHSGSIGVRRIIEGDGEYLTRSRSVGKLLKPITFEVMPVLDGSHPLVAKGLGRQLLTVHKNTPVDGVIELIQNARSIQLLQDLLEASNRSSEASTGAYLSAVAALFSPQPIQVLSETIKFAVRRYRKPRP